MKYRAKITSIQAWVEMHYNTNTYQVVKDATDKYIEVDTPEEADDLEELNRLGFEMRKLELKFTTWYLVGR